MNIVIDELYLFANTHPGHVCTLKSFSKQLQESFYFVPEERVLQMRSYIPVRKPIYCREFPISWRDIDHGIEEVQQ